MPSPDPEVQVSSSGVRYVRIPATETRDHARLARRLLGGRTRFEGNLYNRKTGEFFAVYSLTTGLPAL